MKLICALLLGWLGLPPAAGPRLPMSRIDSLRGQLAAAPSDTGRVLLLAQLAYEHTQTDPLATISFGQQALQLAQRLHFRRGECLALIRLCSGMREAGNYPGALQMGLRGLRLAEALRAPELNGRALNALGYLNWEQGNSRTALAYLFRARAMAEQHHNLSLLTRVMGNIGNVYQQLNHPDSALPYLRRGYALGLRRHDIASEAGDAAMLGNIYARLGQPAQARTYYRRSIGQAAGPRITFALCRAYLGQARLWAPPGPAPADSALYFGLQALAAGQLGHYPKGVLEASRFLAATSAARHDSAAAYRYALLANATSDTLFGQARMAQVQALAVAESLRQQELADQQARVTTERRQLWLLAALAAAGPALLLLLHNNRHKQRANQQLNARNAQIARQRDELTAALAQLKATQAQLVQAEKMTFLGELTAGVAHELQNPLAFVQNFAEVSALLVDDMAGDGLHSPKIDASQALLLDGLKQNLREIGAHGQRATSIIAGMLAHSRGGAAPPTPTDLNALVAESLRLAYQGLRTKDQSFEVRLSPALDPALPPVPVVPQDLSRVLINLFTNALQAVQQRQRTAGPGYAPEVWATTRQLPGGQVEIRVRDNGTGIPAAIKEQIFEPFFTTKPSSEGTGLGLSLARDIVVQGHGGTLTVASEPNAFTEFTMLLPAPG